MRTVYAVVSLIVLGSSLSVAPAQMPARVPLFVSQPMPGPATAVLPGTGVTGNTWYLTGNRNHTRGYPCPPPFLPQQGWILQECPPEPGQSPSTQAAPADEPSDPSGNGNQNSGNTPNLTPDSNGIDLTAYQPEGPQTGSAAGTGSRSRAMQTGANSIGDFFNGSLGRRSLLATGRSALFFPSATVSGLIDGVPGLVVTTDQFRPYTTTIAGNDLNDTVFLRSNSAGQPSAVIPFTADGRSATTSEYFPLNLYPVRASDIAPGSADAPFLEDAGPYVFMPTDTITAFTDPFADPGTTQPQAEFEDTNGNGFFDPGEPIVSYNLYREVVIPNPGGAVGMLKVADNNSPLPQDRVIVDYTLYSDTQLNAAGVDVHRFAPGFEKTIFDQRMSIDVRLPFAQTQGNNIGAYLTSSSDPLGLTDTNDIVLGNLSTTLKILFNRTAHTVLSGGVQAHFPTADDIHVYQGLASGLTPAVPTELVRIENESMNIMPFLAFMGIPNQKWWYQLYVQGDFDVSGNPIYIRDANNVMRRAQTQKDTPFLYTDLSVGRWLYLDQPEIRRTRRGRFVDTGAYGKRGLTGLAARFELHYNTALRDIETVGIRSAATATHFVGEDAGGVDIVNLNLGLTATFGARTEMTVAWGRTVGSSSNQEFGDEIRVLFNLLKPVQSPYRVRVPDYRGASPVQTALFTPASAPVVYQ